MSTKDKAMTVSPNGQQTDVSSSYLFYFRKLSDGVVVGVVDIEPDEHRKGWLKGYVVDCGSNDKVYEGANYNSSADHVFNSGLYDFGKELSSVMSK